MIPIDFSISFADLPNLAGVIRRALSQQPVAYRFEGTVGIDAGRFGTPVLGPMTFLRGTLSNRRTALERQRPTFSRASTAWLARPQRAHSTRAHLELRPF